MDEPFLTLDTDWAPDFTIDFAADILRRHGVRATWFVTHRSPAVERLRREPELFELGIHPNFLPGSTHGDTPQAILKHCLELVPEAVSVRSHSVVQSSPLINTILGCSQFRLDSSLFLPKTPGLRPFPYSWQGRRLLRLPFFWEDDYELHQDEPEWELEALLALGPGLKIFNFHPIHVFLNSRDGVAYAELKRRAPILQEASVDEAAAFTRAGFGAQGTFLELVQRLEKNGCSLHLSDFAKSRRSP